MRYHLIWTLLVLVNSCGASLADEELPDSNRIPIVGYICWPGHDLTNAQVRVTDAENGRLVTVGPTESASGNFMVALPPGRYRMMAVVDVNANGQLDSGDAMGFYGITDASNSVQSPPPLIIDPGALSTGVVIDISMECANDPGEETKLKPLLVSPSPLLRAGGRAVVSGRCQTVLDDGPPIYVLLDAAFPRAPSAAAPCDAEGNFSVELPPAGYFLIAAQDLNGSGMIDEGDLIGIVGYSEEMARNMPLVRLEMDQELTEVEVPVSWGVGADGLLIKDAGAVTGPRLQIGSLPAIVTGKVCNGWWPGATVTFFGDPQLQDRIAQVKCDAAGRFCAALQAASYYISATFDANGDGKLGPGDRAGFYGLDDPAQTGAPPPLSLQPGQIATDIDIPLLIEVPAHDQTAPQNTEPGDTDDTAQ